MQRMAGGRASVMAVARHGHQNARGCVVTTLRAWSGWARHAVSAVLRGSTGCLRTRFEALMPPRGGADWARTCATMRHLPGGRLGPALARARQCRGTGAPAFSRRRSPPRQRFRRRSVEAGADRRSGDPAPCRWVVTRASTSPAVQPTGSGVAVGRVEVQDVHPCRRHRCRRAAERSQPLAQATASTRLSAMRSVARIAGIPHVSLRCAYSAARPCSSAWLGT